MRLVIMLPVHNGRNTLAACIDSILAQTWSDWTLCIVDDGSTDGSFALAQNYCSDPRVHILRQPQQCGLAASLNRVWRSFPADLYARIDADDVCLPERLRLQYQFMQRHPEVAVLGGGAQIVDEQGTVVATYQRPINHEELAARILKENPFIHPTVMMRHSFLEAMQGYDETMVRAQDYDLWLRGVAYFRYHNLPTPLIRYRLAPRPSWQTVYWGAVALARAVRRQRLGWLAYRFPLRFILGTVLVRLGWRQHAMQRRGNYIECDTHCVPKRKAA